MILGSATTPITLTTATTSVRIAVMTTPPLGSVAANQGYGIVRGLMIAITFPLTFWRFILEKCGWQDTANTSTNTCRQGDKPAKPVKANPKPKYRRSPTSYSLKIVLRPQRRCTGIFFFLNRGSR